MDAHRGTVDRLIREHLSDEVATDILGAFFGAYRDAWTYAQQFDLPQIRKVYGAARLALLESGLKVVGQKHRRHLIAVDTPTERGNYQYLALKAGPLLITCAAVAAPDKLPRRAHYRASLARGLQHDLFQNTASAAGRRFWHVLFLHSYERRIEVDAKTGLPRIRRMRGHPGFVQLVVPNRDGLGRVFERSFFAHYPEAVARFRGVAVEQVRTARRPTRKQRPAAEEDAGGGVA